jgi:hypothetical protein
VRRCIIAFPLIETIEHREMREKGGLGPNHQHVVGIRRVFLRSGRWPLSFQGGAKQSRCCGDSAKLHRQTAVARRQGRDGAGTAAVIQLPGRRPVGPAIEDLQFLF